MHTFLASLKQVDVEVFEVKVSEGRCPPNAFVLNEHNELTHLSVVDTEEVRNAIDFAELFFIEIVKQKSLIKLRFSSKTLLALPESIANLSHLTYLDLAANQLSAIPASFSQLKNLKYLSLSQNPVTRQIKDIESNLNPQELITYLLSVQDKNTQPLNEAKILVVGDERVGKTSLINRIIGREMDENQKTTLGIDIQQHLLSNEIQVNIWDFAGQEITHQTHQFFLARHSLYLYVLDSQKEDNDANIHHWLNMIKAYGGDSPIIVVVNKQDLNAGYTFDTIRYSKDFNIVDVCYLSAVNEKALNEAVRKNIHHNIGDLTQSIEKQVAALDHIKFPLPPGWAQVKSALEKMAQGDQNFIENIQYESLCEKHGIDNVYLQNTLLNVLNVIGTLVSYKDSPRLSVMQIINPLWVTNAVYKILRSELIGSNAILTPQHFAEIFKGDRQYKPRHYTWLTDLLKQFNLSFNIDESTLLLPSRLSPNQPDFDLSHYQQGLNFRYSYNDLLKKSVISQFISKMKGYISTAEPRYWQRGVFLQYGDSQGVVISDEERKTITIAIDSNTRMARELLTIIRYNLRSINGEHLIADEEIPLIVEGRLVGYTDYEMLVDSEQEGDVFIRLRIANSNRSSHRFSISDLLDGYRLKDDTRFDYDTLTKDLISIALIESENRQAIFKETEALTNDRFRSALMHKRYNVAEQSRGGAALSSMKCGERDLVVRNRDTGVIESVIEALVLKSLDTVVITRHLNKMVAYDTSGNRRNFILIYVKADDFAGLWQKYCQYLRKQAAGFDDVSEEHTASENLRLGVMKINKMELFHIFVSFSEPTINQPAKRQQQAKTINITQFKEEPGKYNFNVRNFQGIQQIQANLPLNAPWIFLTGDNGYGKTNILQALARVLSNQNDQRVYNGIKPLGEETSLSMVIDGVVRAIPPKTIDPANTYRVLAYGASRLDMGSDRSTKEYRPCSSLFESQVLLRNIEREGLSRWYFIDEDQEKFHDCVDKFKQLMPNLDEVIVKKDSEVWYVEKDNDGKPLQEVQFRDLATGYQNIISMVGDIILNLSAPKQAHEDISLQKHMKAIVLIDELELYLHPKWQKRLPQLLTKLFPDVLFIASTHSPIPLLGAPANSAFFTVNRTAKQGITMTRFDDKIDIDELLPNSVLTSPMFGMEDIYAASFSGEKPVRTEDSFDEVQLNKAIEKKIEDFANNKKETEMIERYMQKAKQRSKQ